MQCQCYSKFIIIIIIIIIVVVVVVVVVGPSKLTRVVWCCHVAYI